MVATAIQTLADAHDARLSDLAPHWRFRLADGLLAYYKVAGIWLERERGHAQPRQGLLL